jgi:hypothetical protein
VATIFSLAPDVSFWGEAELGRAAEFAASVEIDPERTWTLSDEISLFELFTCCGEEETLPPLTANAFSRRP